MLLSRIRNLHWVRAPNPCVEQYLISIPPTRNLVHRLPNSLPHDIPQRDVRPCESVDVETRQMSALPHRIVVARPNRLNVERIAPHHQRPHQFAHDRRSGVRRHRRLRLTPPDDPVIRLNPDNGGLVMGRVDRYGSRMVHMVIAGIDRRRLRRPFRLTDPQRECS